MFRGFNLLTDEGFEGYLTEGKSLHFLNAVRTIQHLKTFISPDGVVDGSAMTTDWFPEIEANVFISHSHRDAERAIGLAGWLHSEFGLKSFIDSCVWGEAKALLKSIDEKYAYRKYPQGDYFDYQTRNQTTTFVNMMLATALNKMIDRTECLIFLNTPNSITTAEAINDKTKSPWIYSEIETSRIIRKRAHRRANEVKVRDMLKSEVLSEGFEGTFDVDLGHLAKIYQSDLDAWASSHEINKILERGVHPLDILYAKNPPSMNTV